MSLPLFLVDTLPTGPVDGSSTGRPDGLSTGPADGLSTGRVGGLSTGSTGALPAGPVGGLSTGPAGGPVTLDGPEGHHAADVQRLRVGAELLLGDGRGALATARVIGVGKGRLELTILHVTTEPAPAPRLVVVQGLAKGDRGELAVQAMTEVGVDEIVPWSASRSVVRWQGERGEKAAEKWRATAREAAKQARRAWHPVIAPLASTAELTSTAEQPSKAGPASSAGLASKAGPVSTAGVSRRVHLVLHEEAKQPLSTVELSFTGPGSSGGARSIDGALPEGAEVVLVVGPEGGIAPEELAAFERAGAVAVRLGSSVLRTSTAGVAALAVLSTRLGRW